MTITNQDAVAFGKVMHSANASYSQYRANAADNRMMIYFQGMKLYVPDGFKPDTLLKLLQTLKKL